MLSWKALVLTSGKIGPFELKIVKMRRNTRLITGSLRGETELVVITARVPTFDT